MKLPISKDVVKLFKPLKALSVAAFELEKPKEKIKITNNNK
ncbi:MAG: hypothetical protein WC483_03225 [Candidatus Paceibacterota bacterium]|jgi:hypothetical protein